MERKRSSRRTRRAFTDEFKAGAVRLVLDGQAVGTAARDLDLTETAVREWVRLRLRATTATFRRT